jgi:enoyl-[acyl-carrier protein] reductase III
VNGPHEQDERQAPKQPVGIDLIGRRALVTGGSRGIGAAIARTLAACGAHVTINYVQNEAAAESTRHEIVAAGGSATLHKANVASGDEVRAMFEAIAAEGPLDILIHNAALGSFKPAMDVRANQWDLSMAVNARALLVCAQAAVPLMAGRGGRIISISSLGSTRVMPMYGAIGVSKAALEALTRTLAVELAPRGIRVNAVSAGLVDTTAVRHHPDYAALAETSVARTPLARLGTPDDVARVVLFLCSPLADWIVGQTLIADGGMSLTL